MVAGDVAAARALPPYTLSNMASDGLGLLTALGIPRAHVMGSSWGSRFAQTVVIEHPERRLTLTSVMSIPGQLEFGQSSAPAWHAKVASCPQTGAGTSRLRRSRCWEGLKIHRIGALASGGR